MWSVALDSGMAIRYSSCMTDDKTAVAHEALLERVTESFE